MKAAMPAFDPPCSYGAGPLGRLRVGEHRDQGRLVRHQREHIARVGRHQGQRGDRAAAATEQFHRANAERLDESVHVLGLVGRRVVDPTIRARAPAEPARVIRDHRAVREIRRQRGEAGRLHRLADHEQRWASLGGRQRATHVVDELGRGNPQDVRCRHDCVDRLRYRNSSHRTPGRARPSPDREGRCRFSVRRVAKVLFVQSTWPSMGAVRRWRVDPARQRRERVRPGAVCSWAGGVQVTLGRGWVVQVFPPS
jgi:hypothetical protein